jgi:hypothetical protein
MFGQDWNAPLGIGFIIALVLALWATFNIAQSNSSTPFAKAVWIVLVLFLPYIGFIAWFFFGPRSKSA